MSRISRREFALRLSAGLGSATALFSALPAWARGHDAAFPGQVFSGRIATINPVIDSGTRTARVTVTVTLLETGSESASDDSGPGPQPDSE